MNRDYDPFQALMRMITMSQAAELYTASLKTFWPGYEKREKESDDEFNNRIERVDTDFQPDFASLADQKAEVRRIQRSAYAKEHWPHFAAAPTVDIVANPESEQFDAWTDGEVNREEKKVRNIVMHLPTGAWGRSRAVLLHELAHAIERYEYDYEKFDPIKDMFDDGHGPLFAKRNVEVVREFYSKEMGDRLEANFRAGGVEIAP